MTITTKPSHPMESLASSAFGFWADGGTHVKLVEEGLDDLSPYVVRMSGKSWIPVNVIVFANGAQHAIERVTAHIQFIKDNSPHREDRHPEAHDPKVRATELLRMLAKGELQAEATLFPVHQISKVQWASNDGVIT